MSEVQTDKDLLAGYESDESGLKGVCVGLDRPSDTSETQELVREASRTGRKLLPVGEQTATTGAAVPQEDTVVSFRKMSGVLDIDRKKKIAEVLPGTITMDLKKAVATEGLYYPPDPTSENECSIGGNVASNASGARTFRWGMTGRWVEGVEVVTGEGDVQRFFRRPVDKNTAGYGPFQDPVSLFVGSEGTLGMVTRVWVRLIDDPGPFVAVVVYFGTLDDAIDTAIGYRQKRIKGDPRCVELFDHQALQFIATHPSKPVLPDNARAALYLEFDLLDAGIEKTLKRFVAPLEQHGALVDDTLVAQSASERAYVRELRHHVPETCNALASRYHSTGGLKVSTEFAVPHQNFLEMMRFVECSAQEVGLDLWARYGHVGNGHPHIFMRGRNPKEVAQCKRLAHNWCTKAVELGGTVSGEHGIGKTRRDFLRYVHTPVFIRAMRNVKRTFDPHNIFAMGNIFPDTPPLVPEFFDDLHYRISYRTTTQA